MNATHLNSTKAVVGSTISKLKELKAYSFQDRLMLSDCLAILIGMENGSVTQGTSRLHDSLMSYALTAKMTDDSKDTILEIVTDLSQNGLSLEGHPIKDNCRKLFR